MAAKFQVYYDKVGKFRFRVKTGNGTRAVMRDSVCLTASMLIGNGHDDRGQYRQCCRIERRWSILPGHWRIAYSERIFWGRIRALYPLCIPNGPWPFGQLNTSVPTRRVTRRHSQWQCPKQTGRAWLVDSELQTIG